MSNSKTLKSKSKSKLNTNTKKCKQFAKKEANKDVKRLKDLFRKTLKIKVGKILSKKMPSAFEEKMTILLCNPGCKNSILEPGNPNVIPNRLKKEMKKVFKTKKAQNILLRYIKKTRKKIFGKKKNVLDEHSMYENARNKDKKYLKKQGALSYCNIQPYKKR